MEDSHLADNYVQEFVLDHLDSVNWYSEYRKMNSISPHTNVYPNVPMHGQPVLYNQIPPPPPNGISFIPPEASSSINSSTQHTKNLFTSYYYGQQPAADFINEIRWLPPQTLQNNPQPLDLPPPPIHHYSIINENIKREQQEYHLHNNVIINDDNFGVEHHPSHFEHTMNSVSVHTLPHNNDSIQSHSVSSSSSISPQTTQTEGNNVNYNQCNGKEDLINDHLLMTLSIMDLNDRLYNCPRKEVIRLKQKRRTLKYRKYAQNYRSQKSQQCHNIDITNTKKIQVRSGSTRARSTLKKLNNKDK